MREIFEQMPSASIYIVQRWCTGLSLHGIMRRARQPQFRRDERVLLVAGGWQEVGLARLYWWSLRADRGCDRRAQTAPWRAMPTYPRDGRGGKRRRNNTKCRSQWSTQKQRMKLSRDETRWLFGMQFSKESGPAREMHRRRHCFCSPSMQMQVRESQQRPACVFSEGNTGMALVSRDSKPRRSSSGCREGCPAER